MKKLLKKLKNKIYKEKNIMNKEKLNLDELRDTIQDCNINFLIGSGLSTPYLSVLGKMESLLTELSREREQEKIKQEQEKIIRASLYKKFFDDVIFKNIDILSFSEEITSNSSLKSTLNNYKNFLRIINSILLNRRSTILGKQVNIFTTNFDIFLEKSLETLNIEHNDGFNGRFNPLFNLSNFKKSFLKRSLHYDNIYEIPVFNLIKIHGSLTWKKEPHKENISFDKNLRSIKIIGQVIQKINSKKLIDIRNIDKITLDDLISNSENKTLDGLIEKFINEYEKLLIVNPTKEKFKETVLNRNYYELLRIYSTELERENTVLFVMGFSFSDEHIREVTIRVANSNPTLKIYVFSYDDKTKNYIEEIKKSRSNNENIKIISLEDIEEKSDLGFNFHIINKKIFNKLLENTSGKFNE